MQGVLVGGSNDPPSPLTHEFHFRIDLYILKTNLPGRAGKYVESLTSSAV